MLEMTLWDQLSITLAESHILEGKQEQTHSVEIIYVPGILFRGSFKCSLINSSQGSRKVDQIIPGIQMR